MKVTFDFVDADRYPDLPHQHAIRSQYSIKQAILSCNIFLQNIISKFYYFLIFAQNTDHLINIVSSFY